MISCIKNWIYINNYNVCCLECNVPTVLALLKNIKTYSKEILMKEDTLKIKENIWNGVLVNLLII